VKAEVKERLNVPEKSRLSDSERWLFAVENRLIPEEDMPDDEALQLIKKYIAEKETSCAQVEDTFAWQE
jgi:hypothetical protein